jgi:hypothetical protein
MRSYIIVCVIRLIAVMIEELRVRTPARRVGFFQINR